MPQEIALTQVTKIPAIGQTPERKLVHIKTTTTRDQITTIEQLQKQVDAIDAQLVVMGEQKASLLQLIEDANKA